MNDYSYLIGKQIHGLTVRAVDLTPSNPIYLVHFHDLCYPKSFYNWVLRDIMIHMKIIDMYKLILEEDIK